MIEQLKKYFVRLIIHLPTAQSYALRWRTDGGEQMESSADRAFHPTPT